MARRRDTSIATDSLELLLDTMCNTFGGVMFIAIALVVISSFIPSVIVELADVADAETKAARLQRDISELETRLGDARARRDVQQTLRQCQDPANPEATAALARLTRANQKAERRENQLTSRMDNLKREINQVQTQIRDDNARLAALAQKLEAKRQRVERAENAALENLKELEANQAQPETRDIAFVKLTGTRKRPFVVILSGDKLYRVSAPGDKLPMIENQFYVSPDVSYSYNSNDSSLRFKPASGKRLGDGALERLKDVNPKKRFIWIMAKDDSFDSLIKFIESLRREGFSYYWTPATNDTDFKLYLVRGTNYQAY